MKLETDCQFPISDFQLGNDRALRKSAIGNWKSAILLSLATTAMIPGCSGHALVHTVPLGTRKINAEGPLLLRESMDECYYWTDDQNRLVIAMRRSHHSLLGKFLDREFVLSFVLPGVPAATSRDYRMDRTTARLFSRFGIYPQRGGSTGGIVAVWDFGKGKLKGRFRFNAKQQTYSVLTGWSGDFTSLYLGEFTAVQNRKRGERLQAQSERKAEPTRCLSEPRP